MTLTSKPADIFSLQELAALWNAAYNGYWFNVQVTPEQLDRRLRTTDSDLSASVVLLRDGIALGFSLFAIREGRGWIGAFGVIPEARRQGFGHRVLEAQLAAAAIRAPRGIQLEVLEQNHARHLYAAHGFEVQRRLAIMSKSVVPRDRTPSAEMTLRPVPLTDVRLQRPAGRPAAWQRDLAAALRHADAAVQVWAIEYHATVLGHLLAERAGATLRLLHLEVPDCLLDLTLQAAAGLDQVDSLLLVNEPEGTALWNAARRADWGTLATQLEMVRDPAHPSIPVP